MKEFPKRRYKNLKQYWADLREILAHLSDIRAGIHKTLDPAFRERLMLVVTQINQCPYCLHMHSKLAQAAGIGAVELRELIAGQIPQDAPEEELPALNYAREWAENHAHADKDATTGLINTYGEEKTRAINLALKMIWIGNLSGNTFDYIIYRLSFGRWRIEKHRSSG